MSRQIVLLLATSARRRPGALMHWQSIADHARLAATLGPRTKRITRKDLNTVDLSKTCELIAEPPEPMALRLSGCLLVGVAR